MTRMLALILAAGLSSLVGGEAHRRTEKGNELYRKGKVDPALTEYQKAQNAAPEAPQLQYDIGNVFYRQENYAAAAEAYEKALGAAGPDLAPRAAYNLGNALFNDKKYDDAIKAYTRALKTAPKDADTKHNLEMALRALEEQKQQQKQKQNKQDQNKDQNKDQKDQKQQQGGGNQKQDQGKKPEGDKKNEGQKPQQAPGSMTAEDAKKLLDRLKDQEKDNVKRAQAAVPKDESTPEKDW